MIFTYIYHTYIMVDYWALIFFSCKYFLPVIWIRFCWIFGTQLVKTNILPVICLFKTKSCSYPLNPPFDHLKEIYLARPFSHDKIRFCCGFMDPHIFLKQYSLSSCKVSIRCKILSNNYLWTYYFQVSSH